MSQDPHVEQAEKIASTALSRLRDDHVAPVPVNYAVWYGYYEKGNSFLVAAIDEALKAYIAERKASMPDAFA